MQDEQSVEVAMWVLILVQTIASVDMPGQGPRKLPAPRVYVPIVVGFSILQIISDSGHAKAAKSMAWLTVLAAAILGPFGIRFVNFLNNAAKFGGAQ